MKIKPLLFLIFCCSTSLYAQKNMWMEFGFSLERGFIKEKYEDEWKKNENREDFTFNLNSRFSASYIFGFNQHHYIKTGVQLAITTYVQPLENFGFGDRGSEVEEINVFFFPIGYRLDMEKSSFEPFFEIGLMPGVFIRSAKGTKVDDADLELNHVQFAGERGVPLFIGAYASIGWNIRLNENTEIFLTPSAWLYRQWQPEFSSVDYYINYGFNLGARYQFYKENTD
jgi:hypothetical protein